MRMLKISHIVNRLNTLPRWQLFAGALVVTVAIVAVLGAAERTASKTELPPSTTHVHVASVMKLSATALPLPVVGKVTSKSEAAILSQSAGEIVSVEKELGDFVAAGAVIARFENNRERAVVLQAEGSYEAALASLAKIKGSGTTGAGIGLSQASTSALNARETVIIALQSSYSTLDDAIHTKSDALFSNPRSLSPFLNLTFPDNQLKVTLQNDRARMDNLTADARTLSDISPNEDIDAAVSSMTEHLRIVESYLSGLIEAINKSTPNENLSAASLSGYQTSLGTARTAVVSALSGLTAAKSAYDSARSGTQTAANTAGQGLESDVAAGEAGVKIAQGALNAARAALEKTIVRSPISGTVVSLPITRGDFVSSFQTVAHISNPDALEIIAHVTPTDAKTLSVGSAAVVGKATQGIIVSIAPALDPMTGKVEVKIGIPGNYNELNSGENVVVSLDRAIALPSQTADITIPIVAVKITPTGPVVFSVRDDTLVAHAIVLGSILGDRVKIADGVTEDMVIVTDARSLSDGQSVIIDTE